MFWSSKAVGVARCIGKGIGIAAAEVYEFNVIADACKQDVVGLEVEMEHLVAVQITDDIQQLVDEFVRILSVVEIIRLTGKALGECLTINVFHQYAIIGVRNVSDKMGMLQTIARFELFTEGLLITDVIGILLFQTFQEVQLAKELYTEGVTCGSLYL